MDRPLVDVIRERWADVKWTAKDTGEGWAVIDGEDWDDRWVARYVSADGEQGLEEQDAKLIARAARDIRLLFTVIDRFMPRE